MYRTLPNPLQTPLNYPRVHNTTIYRTTVFTYPKDEWETATPGSKGEKSVIERVVYKLQEYGRAVELDVIVANGGNVYGPRAVADT